MELQQSTRLSNVPLKRIKQHQRLALREKNFQLSPMHSSNPYNAIEDVHAQRYFQNRPVKKRLKSLMKVSAPQNRLQAVHQLPLTTNNKQLLATLQDYILQREIANETTADGIQTRRSQSINTNKREIRIETIKTSLPTQHSRKMKTIGRYDPYSNMREPSVEQISQLRSQIIKERQREISILPSIKKNHSAPRQNTIISHSQTYRKDQKHRISTEENDPPRTTHGQHNELLKFVSRKKSKEPLKESQELIDKIQNK